MRSNSKLEVCKIEEISLENLVRVSYRVFESKTLTHTEHPQGTEFVLQIDTAPSKSSKTEQFWRISSLKVCRCF